MKRKYLWVLVLFFLFLTSVSINASQVHTFPINEESTLQINIINANERPIAFGMGLEEVTFDYYFRERSAGKFYAEEQDTLLKDLSEKGSTDITVFADSPELYKVLFIFDIKFDDPNLNRKLTREMNFEFTDKKRQQFAGYMAINDKKSLTSSSAYIEEGQIYIPLANSLHILGRDLKQVNDNAFVIDKNGYDSITLLEEVDGFFKQQVSEYYVSLDKFSAVFEDTGYEKIMNSNNQVQVLKFYNLVE